MVSSAEDPGSILGQEDLLETGMVTHSSLLVWRTPWTEGSGGLWSMGSQSQTWLSDFHYTPATLGERFCQTLGWPARGGLQTAFHACRAWGCTELHSCLLGGRPGFSLPACNMKRRIPSSKISFHEPVSFVYVKECWQFQIKYWIPFPPLKQNSVCASSI